MRKIIRGNPPMLVKFFSIIYFLEAALLLILGITGSALLGLSAFTLPGLGVGTLTLVAAGVLAILGIGMWNGNTLIWYLAMCTNVFAMLTSVVNGSFLLFLLYAFMTWYFWTHRSYFSVRRSL
jgi:hypothetical protein